MQATRCQAFAAALLDPEQALPAGLVGPDGEPSARRFAVYRNNVVVGLVEALKHAYPAVLRIVGNEFFTATARLFATRHPPRTPVMLDYGAGFAEFLESFEPVAALPYLPDIARLERAWLEAYHAAEAEPLDPAALQALDPQLLPDLRLRLHPATRVLRSDFPTLRIWQMNVIDDAPTPIDLGSGGEDALVTRPGAEVAVQLLPPGAGAFIEALADGASVVDATLAASTETTQFELAGTLGGLLAAGALAGWSLPEGGRHGSGR